MHAAARAWSGQVSGNQAVVKVGRRCPFSEPSCSFTRLFGFDCCAVRRMETAEKLAKLKEIKPGPWSIPGDHQWKSIYVWSMKFRVRIKWKYTVMIINLFRVLSFKVKRDQARAMIYSGWPSNEHPSTVNSSSMSAQENPHVGAPFWFHLYKTFKFGWIQVDNCPF